MSGVSTPSRFFGRPFAKRFALCYRTVVCLSCPVCDIGVLWPNGWMDQDGTWRAGRPRRRPHCVRWGPSSPTEMGTAAPRFRNSRAQLLRPYNPRPMSIVAKTAGWIKTKPGMDVGLGHGHTMLDGDPVPPPPEGHSLLPLQFSAHVCCGQTAEWVKMPLGTKVDLGLGHIV